MYILPMVPKSTHGLDDQFLQVNDLVYKRYLLVNYVVSYIILKERKENVFSFSNRKQDDVCS